MSKRVYDDITDTDTDDTTTTCAAYALLNMAWEVPSFGTPPCIKHNNNNVWRYVIAPYLSTNDVKALKATCSSFRTIMTPVIITRAKLVLNRPNLSDLVHLDAMNYLSRLPETISKTRAGKSFRLEKSELDTHHLVPLEPLWNGDTAARYTTLDVMRVCLEKYGSVRNMTMIRTAKRHKKRLYQRTPEQTAREAKLYVY